MDANLLIALVAPRPLLLQTGNTDFWSDPKGEFLAAVSAGPVYKLLGQAGSWNRRVAPGEASLPVAIWPTTCTTAATAWCRQTGLSMWSF